MPSLRGKHFDRWLWGYVSHLGRQARLPPRARPSHILFALCDHYEPLWGGADERTGQRRVRRWLEQYAANLQRFRDADGRMPQHTWFFPGEEYRPSLFSLLGELVAQGTGELELHLHHDRDTPAGLRSKLREYVGMLTENGHLSRLLEGQPRYAFIHGNWALANGRPDGRLCGVDAELPILFETGCYADFTFPSCPDVTQPRMVNVLYWPTGDLARRRAYDGGEPARVGTSYSDRILVITGPLALRRSEQGLLPQLEYGTLTAQNPPTARRVRTWVSQHIHVQGRPEWTFVKVYTHGAPERQAESLLGPGARVLHEILTSGYNDGTDWQLHYVTAREMFNIARAAMDGKQGNPNDYRNYVLPPPPIRRA